MRVYGVFLLFVSKTLVALFETRELAEEFIEKMKHYETKALLDIEEVEVHNEVSDDLF